MPERLRVSASTANLCAPITAREALTWGPDQHLGLAAAGDLDGVELWPINPITRLVRSGNRWEMHGCEVLSAHQSPRSENLLSVARSIINGDLYRQSGAYFALTDPEGSLRDILNLVKKMESQGWDVHDFTTNYYPDIPVSPKERARVHNPVVQTYPGAIEVWGVGSTASLIDYVRSNNLGLCISTMQMRRVGKDGKPTFLYNWQETIPELLKSGLVKQVHLELARVDVPGMWGDVTTAEAYDLGSTSKEDTGIKAMLRLIAENWMGHITIEALSSGIAPFYESVEGGFQMTNMAGFYKRVRDNLSTIFKS